MKIENHKPIIDAIQDAIYIISNDVIIYVNDEFYTITGYDESEVINSKYTNFIFDQNNIEFIDNLYKTVLINGNGNKREFEFKLKHKNGNIIYVIISSLSIIIDNSLYIIGTIKNITDKVVSDMKFKEIENNYKVLLELCPDPIVVSDLNGTIIDHNISAYNINEPTSSNFVLLGKNVTDNILNDDGLQNIISSMNKTSESEYKYDINYKTQTGKIIPFQLHTCIVYDSNGKALYRITIGRDISELKNQELLLKKSIDDKENTIKEIHHRLKNTVQQIYSLLGIQSKNLEYNYRNMTSNEKIDIYQNIFQQILLDTQQRVLVISIIHNLFYTDDIHHVNFSVFLNELILSIRKMYDSENKITINISGDKLKLELDDIIPCGLIANEILSNSFKHAFNNKDNGTISISVQSNGNNKITFSDNGIGIKKKDIEDKKKLGIPLIYGLAEQISAKINFKSDQNGTIYELILKGNENVRSNTK